MLAATCPRCQRPLPTDAPHGICPACLMTAAVGLWAEAPAGSPAAEPPARVGDFELLEELGRGATGAVWLARQVRLNRRVALKLLALPALHDEESRQRFEREAQAIAALHHPHIVQVYEVGTHEGRPFFAMEWIAGSNLAVRLRQTLPTARQAAQWLRALAEAVAHAHSRGVVHRDLKPANILLDAASKPYLTDFGLAKLLGTESDLTLTGLAVGSAQYMAPEQAAGQNAEVGPLADIHALGAVLYHALTGRPPFLASTLAGTLKQVLEAEPVPPRKLNPSVPRDLETICLKCLEKAPSQRYASAQALAEDLDRFLQGRPIQARPVSPLGHAWRACRRRPVVSALSAALVLVVLAGSVGVTVQWRQREATARQLASHQRRMTLESAHQRTETNPSAGLAAYADLLRREPHLRPAVTRLLFTLSQYSYPLPLALLPHPAEVRLARFSPDGRHIVTMCARHNLRLWDARDYTFRAGPRRLAGPVRLLQFSADGRVFLLVGDADPVALCHTESLEQRFTPPVTGLVERATLSDDARLLLVRQQDGAASLWDTAGETAEPVLRFETTTAAALSPNGQYLAIGRTNGVVQVWDTDTRQPACAAWNLSAPVTGLRFSPSNLRVAVLTPTSLRLWHLNEPRPSGYVELKPAPLEAVFSPDGQRLAVVQSGPLLRLYDFLGRSQFDLGRDRDVLPHAAFTPETLRLLTREKGRCFALWNMVTERTASRPVCLSAPIADLSMSPEGRRLLATGGLEALPVWDISMGGASEPTARHEGRLHMLNFSRNGRWLLTASADGTARLLDARTLQPAGPPLRHTAPVLSARFRPDDQCVLTASQDGTAQLWSIPGGEPAASPMRHPLPVQVGEFSPDGKIVATVTADATLRLWRPAGVQPSGLQTGSPLHTAVVQSSGLQTGSLHQPVTLTAHALDTNAQASALDLEPSVPSSNLSGRCSGQFSPDGRRFLVVSAAGQAVLWDVLSGALVGLLADPGAVTVAQFSPDGTCLATAGRDGWVRLWNPTNGAALGRPLSHGDAVASLAFSPDGTLLVSGGTEGRAQLWHVRSGALLRRLSPQASTLAALSFSPDGSELATFTSGHIGRVWDVATGLPTTGRFSGQAKAGLTILFSPDGRWLACGMTDGSVRLYEHPVASTPAPAWLLELAELLAQMDPATEGPALEQVIRRWLELRRQLQALPGDDFYARWGRWFAADRSRRTVTPHSPLTVPELVDLYLEQGTDALLHDAVLLMPDGPRCAARLAERLAKHGSAWHPRPASAAAFYRRRAGELETLAQTAQPTSAPAR